MSSVAADTLAAPASRPILDRKPSRTTLLLFLLLLLIGVGYSGYSLVSDISGVPAQRLTWLPFLLLGVGAAHRARLRIRQRLSRHGQRRRDRDLHPLACRRTSRWSGRAR